VLLHKATGLEAYRSFCIWPKALWWDIEVACTKEYLICGGVIAPSSDMVSMERIS
jgi:hypothetical protein